MAIKIHLLYEHGADLRPFGSASIRLLRPLTHPNLAPHVQVTSGTTYAGQPVDLLIVDRLWRPDVSLEAVEQLRETARKAGARLVYAVDDSFLDIPVDAEARLSEAKAGVFEFLLRQSDCVWVTSPRLKERFAAYNRRIAVIPHALDERLIVPRYPGAARTRPANQPYRIGFMGTLTHDQDLEMVAPALRQVCDRHPGQIEIQIIGGIAEANMPKTLAGLPVRLVHTEPGEEEYPLFMIWFTGRSRWDLAIAPLQDNEFNRCKSSIKFLDYSAIACPAVYSDLPAYHGTVDHLRTGLLVGNQTEQWTAAIEMLLGDENLRQRIAWNSYRELHASHTLARASSRWLEALEYAMQPPAPPPSPAVSIVIPTKNAEPYLAAQLEAIYAQATTLDFDVTLVDSGSKDRTPEIAAAHPVNLLRIPAQEFNHGLTRNLGARQARQESEFIVFLSQDACPADPGWLENLIRPMLADEAVAGVFSRHIPRREARASCVRQLTCLTQSGGTERLYKQMPADPAEFQAQRFYLNFFSNTSSAIRRKVWEKQPFEAVDFAEDALWADTVLQRGHVIVFEPASVVIHSHDYSPIEQFRQNVDHARGFDLLFNPAPFHDRRLWLKQFLGIPLQVFKDCIFVIKSPFYSDRSLCYKLYMMLLSPPWQLATVTGAWVGANFRSMPQWLKRLASRQTRIKLE